MLIRHIKNPFLNYIVLISVCIGTFLYTNAFAGQTDKDALLTIPSGIWFNGPVYVITPQDSNKMLVWWEFTWYNWYTTNKIVRLYTDGRRDATFDIWSGFNDAIRAIVIQNDGKILVWWHFTNYNWTVVNRIIRLNTDGSIDTSFVIWSWFNAQVRVIALQNDGKILVWGAITNYNWTTIYRIARLNTNGAIDSSFNVWLGFNNNIRSIVFQDDGKIILGWWFVVYNWTTTNRIIRVNPNGSRDNTFIIWSGFNEQINSILLLSDGKILVWGLFTGYNWTSVNRIARLNTDGSLDTTFDIWGWFNSQVVSFVIDDEKIIVWWTFTGYDSTIANRIIRLHTDGSTDTSFNFWVWFDNAVRFLSRQPDGKILVWGDFTTYKWASFWWLIRLNGNSHISLLDTDNEDVVRAEFISKWYTLSGDILSWSAPMVFVDTLWRVPTPLTLKNNNILLTLPQDLHIKRASNHANYTWTFFPPTPIPVENTPNADFAFSVWSDQTSLELSNWVATLSAPVVWKHAGDTMYIYYSEDNGDTWLPHTETHVVAYNDQAYVTFTTPHFTDFAIWSYTWTFIIDNDATSTTTGTVALDINAPWAINMRFSNDWISWSSWETYTTSKTWTLSAGYGTKIVYAQFDIDGDTMSDVQTSDEISYTISFCPPWAYCGDITLRIDSLTAQCVYGTSVNLGLTWFSYSAQSLITWFLAQGNSPRYCQDTEGDSQRAFSVQMLTDLINTSNPSYFIPENNVLISNPQATAISWSCTPDTISNTLTPIGTVTQLFGKASAITEICTIITDNVGIQVNIPWGQQIGAYSGTLQISYDATLGNGSLD